MSGWVPTHLPDEGRRPLPRLAARPKFVARERLGSGREREVRLFVGRHRRPLTLALVLLATGLTVRLAVPDRPPLVGVLVAAHDLPAGRAVTAGDLRAARWPADALPTGRVSDLGEQPVLASPLRAGEPLTDARLLGPGLLTGERPDTVAVPVRLSDPSTAALVRAGDRVDVLSGPSSSSTAPTDAGAARHLVLGARVLAVPSAAAASGEPATGGGLASGLTGGTGAGPDDAATGVLVLAVTSGDAERLAGAQPRDYLGVAVLGRS